MVSKTAILALSSKAVHFFPIQADYKYKYTTQLMHSLLLMNNTDMFSWQSLTLCSKITTIVGSRAPLLEFRNS